MKGVPGAVLYRRPREDGDPAGLEETWRFRAGVMQAPCRRDLLHAGKNNRA